MHLRKPDCGVAKQVCEEVIEHEEPVPLFFGPSLQIVGVAVRLMHLFHVSPPIVKQAALGLLGLATLYLICQYLSFF